MNSKIKKSLGVIALLTTIISAGPTRAFALESCDTQSTPVKMAMVFISLVERGGLDLLEPIDENGRTVEQLCTQLVTDKIAPATDGGETGAITVTLNLQNEVCTLDMTLVGDKVDDVYNLNCRKN